MARTIPNAASGSLGAAPTPDQWPDWVLAFNGGFFELDKVRQDAQHEKFREWKESSRKWLTDHGIKYSYIERQAEFRRRAHVHQKLHPEEKLSLDFFTDSLDG